tara:strand:- start:109 stop:333 length:225 start_codon:yes stop_codon:yes gene_type:complete
VTEINSEVLEPQNQSEERLETKNKKKEANIFLSIISLMNKNPNYKMLGALGMMLVNFSICVLIANWLKNSSLVS